MKNDGPTLLRHSHGCDYIKRVAPGVYIRRRVCEYHRRKVCDGCGRNTLVEVRYICCKECGGTKFTNVSARWKPDVTKIIRKIKKEVGIFFKKTIIETKYDLVDNGHWEISTVDDCEYCGRSEEPQERRCKGCGK